jgi:O-antigen ligase
VSEEDIIAYASIFDAQDFHIDAEKAVSTFVGGLSHWMPAAEAYYQPWHIDNLYLDLLLELGVVGALLLGGGVLMAGVAVARGLRQRDPLAWALGVSLLGFLSLGLLISATEVPRVLLLALLTVTLALGLWTNRRTDCL